MFRRWGSTRANFSTGIATITADIEADVKALETASWDLLSLLLPFYTRRREELGGEAALKPVEGDEDAP